MSRVNLGCGGRPRPGYVNVDIREVEGVDILADVRDVEKIGIGQYEGFLAEHILEHFSFRETVNILQLWRSLLTPGGGFQIDVPNGAWQVRAVASGEIDWEQFVYYAYGEQDYPENCHYTSFSQSSLQKALEDAGFVDVSVSDIGQVLVAIGRNRTQIEEDAITAHDMMKDNYGYR